MAGSLRGKGIAPQGLTDRPRGTARQVPGHVSVGRDFSARDQLQGIVDTVFKLSGGTFRSFHRVKS